MKINDFEKLFSARLKEVQGYIEGNDVKDIMGVEAVNHFKDSFQNEGFKDKTVVKWKDVKRRDKNSSWYGHSGQTGKFSAARTSAPVLSGEARELQESISYTYQPHGARVTNDTPYARVHQFGEEAYVYGKKKFKMTARPFMGKSVVLKRRIEEKIKREIKNILKR